MYKSQDEVANTGIELREKCNCMPYALFYNLPVTSALFKYQVKLRYLRCFSLLVEVLHCRFCGDEVRSLNYLRDRHYVCKECKPHKEILLKTGIFD